MKDSTLAENRGSLKLGTTTKIEVNCGALDHSSTSMHTCSLGNSELWIDDSDDQLQPCILHHVPLTSFFCFM